MAAGRGVPAYGLAILIAAGALVADPGAPAASAASACSGRPLRTVPFATGEVRVYKSRDYACAIAVAKKPGKKRAMSISLQPRGGSPVTDRGQYTRQAGPVTVHALNRCVRATGSVSGKSASTGWILC
ncbi:hypothetical protein ACFY7Z_22305 [Streptomyces sp. NPDC012623]|uniref:hypothetical protein n=1 Tax=unclassified Streptomyces TaxID=2593676 RepID=UPI0036BD09B4